MVSVSSSVAAVAGAGFSAGAAAFSAGACDRPVTGSCERAVAGASAPPASGAALPLPGCRARCTVRSGLWSLRAWSTVSVGPSTRPPVGRPCLNWNQRTAARVCGPNSPSTGPGR